MIFSAKQDVEAPIEHVFMAVSDFEGFTRQAMRRGAEVTRLDAYDEPTAGMAWNTMFHFRGKQRKMRIELQKVDAPNGLTAKSSTKGLEATLQVELVAMSKQRTRMSIELELDPQTLAARLLVQSLKLARGSITKRLAKRLDGFAKATEESYHSVS
ncbi:SRPBCC family protein [Lentibacter sp. XHP0401]|jgi:uncharacterized protein YndB with AHSA1/START domain|uniref:SRPBCC family protein n=1 Tax=Lentibacter sp. XHP0401 TaxID=2984334 RepID=UPI0021E80197|nr:SRPBCC family protein [Lentibacter sp. XHP0401]MCV2893491.1 SRPBCC family protein [Lentibacter sp. XHP0401]